MDTTLSLDAIVFILAVLAAVWRLEGRIVKSRVKLKSAIAESRAKLKSDDAETHAELKSDEAETRAELKSDIRRLENRIDRLEARLDDLERRLDEKIDEVDRRLGEMTDDDNLRLPRPAPEAQPRGRFPDGVAPLFSPSSSACARPTRLAWGGAHWQGRTGKRPACNRRSEPPKPPETPSSRPSPP